jgi:hypothetical protein
MIKIILLSKNKNNVIKYISNTCPLLWTNNKSEAKTFMSEGEMNLELSYHEDILNKMAKQLGLSYYKEYIND